MEIKGRSFREGEPFIQEFFNSYNIFLISFYAGSGILLKGKVFPEILEATLVLEKSLPAVSG